MPNKTVKFRQSRQGLYYYKPTYNTQLAGVGKKALASTTVNNSALFAGVERSDESDINDHDNKSKNYDDNHQTKNRRTKKEKGKKIKRVCPTAKTTTTRSWLQQQKSRSVGQQECVGETTTKSTSTIGADSTPRKKRINKKPCQQQKD